MIDFLSFFLFPMIGSLKTDAFPDKLSDEMEEKYIKKFLNGDIDARSKLIIHNLRLVAHIVKKYEQIDDKDDLLSIGTIGLIKAVDTYNPNSLNKLATYAARCIENEILMHIRNIKNKKCTFLNSYVSSAKDGSIIELIDVIKDDSIDTLDNMINKDKIIKLKKALSILNKREYEIIEARYGLNNKEPLTQKEIANYLNISRSYVSRIEKRALMKLYLELLK